LSAKLTFHRFFVIAKSPEQIENYRVPFALLNYFFTSIITDKLLQENSFLAERDSHCCSTADSGHHFTLIRAVKGKLLDKKIIE